MNNLAFDHKEKTPIFLAEDGRCDDICLNPSFRQPGYQPLLARGFASLGHPRFAIFEEVVLLCDAIDHKII